ncbi:MAG: NERD domain-containing protein [Clostridia bacterium]|nr:NERD domain-containing protein [Clostridia bacterium]
MIIKKTGGSSRKGELESLNQTVRERTKQGLFCLLGLAVSLALFFLGDGTGTRAVANLGIVGTLVCVTLAAYYFWKRHKARSEAEVVHAGVVGESRTIRALEDLPDTYYALQDVHIPFEGKVTELDLVVVGTTGVFLLETKNQSGTIRGSDDDPKLVRTTVSKGGTTYTKEFQNPVKKVSNQTVTLANYLRYNGALVWVQGMVYFADPEADVLVKRKKNEVPVYSAAKDGPRALRRYILDYPAPRPLSQETVKSIVDLLR